MNTTDVKVGTNTVSVTGSRINLYMDTNGSSNSCTNIYLSSNETLKSMLDNKQDCLQPGDGIKIENGAITATEAHFTEFKNSTNIALGNGASATATSVSIGTSANSSSTGISIGQLSSGQGIAVGHMAKSDLGSISIGSSANSKSYAVVIGNEATSNNENGISIGRNSQTTGTDAIAVGYNSNVTNNGIAIGSQAIASNNAVQIGKGTNTQRKTLKIFEFQIIDTNGQIPMDRISSSMSTKQDVLSPGTGIHIENNTISATEDDFNLFKSGAEISIGKNASATNLSCAIGINSEAKSASMALGNDAKSSAMGAVQIGTGTNDTNNSLKFQDVFIVKDGALAINEKEQLSYQAGDGIKITKENNGVFTISADPSIDNTITPSSNNPVSSKAIYAKTQNLENLVKNNETNINSKESKLTFGPGLIRNGNTVSLSKSSGNLEAFLNNPSVEIGSMATHPDNSGMYVALGGETKSASYSVAIGYKASANYTQDVAIGMSAKTMSSWSVAIGNSSTSNGIAIGHLSSAQGIAIGRSAVSKDTTSVAIGDNAVNEGIHSVAIGTSPELKDLAKACNNATAIGFSSNAGDNSICIGSGSYADGNAVSVGTEANASVSGAIALGYQSKAETNSVAVGGPIEVYTQETGKIQKPTVAKGTKSISILGEALKDESIAIGPRAIADANRAIQLGTGINRDEKTLKVFEYTILREGKIPSDVVSTTTKIESGNHDLVDSDTVYKAMSGISGAVIDDAIKDSPNAVMNRAILNEFHKLRTEISVLRAMNSVDQLDNSATADNMKAKIIEVANALRSSSLGELITVPDESINTFSSIKSAYLTLRAEIKASVIADKILLEQGDIDKPAELVIYINQLITNLKTI